MDFSLSSSLIGSAVLNPDKLSLDLQFAADKTLTARKGPNPVFTRASSGTFVGSNGLIQSAGTNVARFDHDPVTLGCKGLLIEESRTNVALYSGAIVNNIGWQGNATPSVSGTGPDGNSSYQISEIATTGVQSIANTGGTGALQATSVVTGTTYTGSIFVKKVAGSVDWVQITFGGSGFGTVPYANFNIGNGTVGNSAGLASGTSPRIENYGNGWYRLSISVAASVTIVTNNVILAFIQNTNGTTRLPSYSGSASNSVLASLCQFETGAFPTSYIPTTTASVIRSADVCSISGSAFSGMYNQPEGTLVTSSTRVSTNTNAFVGHYSDNSFSNGFDVRYNTSTQVGVLMNVANSNQLTGMQVTITAGSVAKQAFSYKLNDCGYSVNGAATITDTSALIPTATRMAIGNAAVLSAAVYLNGTISSMRYYKKRLSNSKLQTLTV
jgi:hypothetical protein